MACAGRRQRQAQAKRCDDPLAPTKPRLFATGVEQRFRKHPLELVRDHAKLSRIHPKLLLCVLLERQRKESQMDPGQLSMVADKFQWVFSETLLNACGKEARFCRRQRIITPFRLGLALTATCASHRVETLADFHRGFNALFDTTIT